MANDTRIERMSVFLRRCQLKGCSSVSLNSRDDELNLWTIEGVKEDELASIATEIDEFCTEDVDGLGSPSSYTIKGLLNSDIVCQSPRFAYRPDAEHDDSPSDLKSLNRSLMQHTATLNRLFATTAPQLLEAQSRLTRTLLENQRDSEQNRIDAFRAIEKAKSKEHKRELKRIKVVQLEEHKTEALKAFVPHLPRVLGGLAKFALGKGDVSQIINDLGDGEESKGSGPPSEAAQLIERLKGAFMGLTTKDQTAIESKLPGLLDRFRLELMSKDSAEVVADRLMGLALGEWEGCSILEGLKAALGEDRFTEFATQAGIA